MSLADAQNQIDLLFNRSLEPIFIPKGDKNESFAVTETFLDDEYKGLGIELSNRFGESDKIPLAEPSTKPDLAFAAKITKWEPFTVVIPKHEQIASQLIEIFMKVPANQLNDFVAVGAYCREKINPKLFNYAFSVALLNRPDTSKLRLPNFIESFPTTFLDGGIFQDARETAALVPKEMRAAVPITLPRDLTASDLEPEHRMAYFREDIGINLHHWHWHLVYPFSAGRDNINIVNKDRRGELFYYMHHQIIARFNAERLCNVLPRVKKFNNFTDQIPEGYYSKLDSLTGSRGWPPRQANMTWHDLNRPYEAIRLSVNDIRGWRARIEEAISKKTVRSAAGGDVPLTIDILGNMVEASDLSINKALYGNLHNSGHLMMAYIHDPDYRYLESFSIMADEATAMRDPFFYRWHSFLDDLFSRHKATLTPYLRAELDFTGVRITDINLSSGTGPANRINTFWMQSIVDLSRGLDFAERGAVYTRFTHLNHEPFTYTISASNSAEARFATCRVFLAPKLDERGLPWQFDDQRGLFVEMDRFVTQLQPGNNTISRLSTDSSVTIPFERTFRNLRENPRDFTNQEQALFNFCGCGWPQHMLVPKGTEAGMVFQLFVMLSNYNQDSVNQNTDNIPCSDASSFCGIRDRLYPDKRAMGFPFDRPSTNAAVVDQFLTPNMGVREVTIQHKNSVTQNPMNPTAS